MSPDKVDTTKRTKTTAAIGTFYCGIADIVGFVAAVVIFLAIWALGTIVFRVAGFLLIGPGVGFVIAFLLWRFRLWWPLIGFLGVGVVENYISSIHDSGEAASEATNVTAADAAKHFAAHRPLEDRARPNAESSAVAYPPTSDALPNTSERVLRGETSSPSETSTSPQKDLHAPESSTASRIITEEDAPLWTVDDAPKVEHNDKTQK